MRKNNSFFSSMGFYIVLAIGAIALISLLVYYNRSTEENKEDTDVSVDLNEGVAGNLTTEEKKTKTTEEKEKTKTKKTTTESTTEEKAKDVFGDKDNSKNNEEIEYGTGVSEVKDTVDNPSAFDGEQSLAWPMAGEVIMPFSMDTTVYYETLDIYKCNPGILIKGDEGTDVFASCAGTVKSVKEDAERGTCVTLDLGNGYEIMYGQLMNVTVNEGDKVLVNTNIGEVAPATKYYTEEGSHLYFQMSKDGEYIDPMLFVE